MGLVLIGDQAAMPPSAPGVHLPSGHDPQQPLPLSTPGVARWLWQSRFGPMLIEVDGDAVYVNGQRVQPCPPAQTAATAHRP